MGYIAPYGAKRVRSAQHKCCYCMAAMHGEHCTNSMAAMQKQHLSIRSGPGHLARSASIAAMQRAHTPPFRGWHRTCPGPLEFLSSFKLPQFYPFSSFFF